MKEKISITLSKHSINKIDSIVDNVFIRNRSQAIEHLIETALGGNRTAVILCGGDEKNLELSKGVYQMTAVVKGKPVVEHAVMKLRESGYKKIIVVARAKVLTKIFETVKDGAAFGVKIEYVEEKSSSGSADSLRLVKGRVNSPFLVVYGDIIFDNVNLDRLWNAHITQNYMVTMMMTTSKNPSMKGTLRVEGNKVLEFTQKPKTSDVYLVFSPIFVCDPEVLERNGKSLLVSGSSPSYSAHLRSSCPSCWRG